ncbi:hypothetical protein MXAN_4368 [Myxococcus xanthus DK 1622]|uniref:Uncharacterized protein n=1 Tax=Myxococcus xanthus (strain DK1622) TaxID=246197 RepID=Q1D482_MYXXD|nr:MULTISPECIES: hypothetical protein [Myxococcus]ABF91282.1 hypothetical protein MXAN_4368 [Myxococcus xanthus DK 1622]NOJ51081.1 hypothetical protein [Myxococcus xanthus]QPM76956.1 hypothetical protein I5Q59_21595 [Myxococcus xanthus]QVW66023.1 hypothetical protein JTM82_26950 [Myxococcus xanthus DZ2]QZZ52050.1 hypothetical protein MyxoNM_22840 [Myxococcus xanthus]
MKLMTALRSVAVASLFIAAPVLAQTAAPESTHPPAADGKGCGGHHRHKGKKHGNKMARLEHRMDKAVAEGRLSQAQADQFKAEGRQLREEMKAQREASGGKLSDAQKDEMRSKMRAFREKMKSAMQANAPQKT